MKKWIIIEISLFLLIIIGLLYPAFNNVKTKTFKPIEIKKSDYILSSDSVYYKTTLKSISNFNEKYTFLFNDDNIIYNYRKVRNDNIVYYFRFTETYKYFEDTSIIHFHVFFYIIIIVVYLVFTIHRKTDIWSNSELLIDIQLPNYKFIRLDFLIIHNVLEFLFLMILSTYVYTYTQTAWFDLLFLNFIWFLILRNENFYKNIKNKLYVIEKYNEKTNQLKTNYKRLLK